MRNIVTAIALFAVLLIAAGSQAAVYNVPGQFTSIQAAIDAAASGDTVQIAAGTYRESTTTSKDLEITKSLSLVGAGSSSTIIELSDNNAVGLDISGANLSVSIQGIRFTRRGVNQYASSNSLQIAGTASSIDNLVLRDVEVAYAKDAGIALGSAGSFANVVIENCNIHHCGTRGVYSQGTVSAMTVTNCHFYYCGMVNSSLGAGFDLAGTSSNVNITGGSFSYNKKSGINLCRTTNLLFTGVTAYGNNDYGFNVWESSATTSNVRFTRCSAVNNGVDGIVIGTQNSGSFINGVEISGCQISSNKRWGVNVYEPNAPGTISGITINDSSLVGNAAGVSASGPTIVNAKNNWWGSTDGPRPVGLGSGDRVTSNVDYIPFLTKPTGQNVLWLGAESREIYVKAGDTATVTLNQSGLTEPSAGYQAFLSFDSSKLSITPTNISITPVGSPYTLPILKRMNGGIIDLAAGIDNQAGGVPSQADAKLAELTFLVPLGTSEGMTQITFRQNDPPTMLTNPAGDEIPAWTVNSPSIIIDNTAPSVPTIILSPSVWTKSNSTNITFSASDTVSGGVWSSIDYYTLSVDGGVPFRAVSPYMLDTSSFSTGQHTVNVTAYDKAGNSSSASAVIRIDRVAPTVTITSAKQSGVELIPSGTAIQGTVEVLVTASDNHSGLGSAKPSVTVTAGSQASDITSTGTVVSPGVWKYIWQVTPSTPNGTVTISALVQDTAGNIGTAASKTFSVNKTQAYVTLELQGVYVPSVTRPIKFTLGGTGGTVTYSVTKPVVFTSDGMSEARGTITITGIPNTGSWTCISAKDEQHTLKGTLQLTGTLDKQYSASFVGVDRLIGGDMNNDQTVDIKDFGVFSGQFGSRYNGPYVLPAKDADMTNDGGVDSADFSFIQINFMKLSDPECGGAQSSAVPLSSVSVSSLKADGVKRAEEADLNKDGMVDTTDIQLFIQKYIQVKRGR